MTRKLFNVLLILAMALSLTVTAFAATPESSDIEQEQGVYIAVMRADPVIAYEGDISGMPATKPGKGGILPGAKVSPQIAEIRGIRVGEDSISPNRHPEINSVPELLDFLDHIREVTGKPVGFKSVIGAYD